MKIVRFLGGLGNQMFQYAFYLALSQRFSSVKADVSGFENYGLHNGFELERIFNIKLRHASGPEINLINPDNRKWVYRKLRRILFIKPAYYEEDRLFFYQPDILTDASSKIYWGYWQHHQYTAGITDKLRKDFTFPPLLPSRNLDVFNQLMLEESSVAIHVRRGDYLKDPYLGGLATPDYFQRGISLMEERIKTPRFYIFSDDIGWSKEHLSVSNAVFVDWNKEGNSFRDMQLISQCKHAIISNSSFSWWAAWLNRNPEKLIIVPSIWYRSPDVHVNTHVMHPPSWINI